MHSSYEGNITKIGHCYPGSSKFLKRLIESKWRTLALVLDKRRPSLSGTAYYESVTSPPRPPPPASIKPGTLVMPPPHVPLYWLRIFSHNNNVEKIAQKISTDAAILIPSQPYCVVRLFAIRAAWNSKIEFEIRVLRSKSFSTWKMWTKNILFYFHVDNPLIKL